MYNNYFAIYLTPTQYCKSTAPQLKTTKKHQNGESKPNLNSNKKKKKTRDKCLPRCGEK